MNLIKTQFQRALERELPAGAGLLAQSVVLEGNHRTSTIEN